MDRPPAWLCVPDAAHSMAAVGMLAPFVESLFVASSMVSAQTDGQSMGYRMPVWPRFMMTPGTHATYSKAADRRKMSSGE